MRLKIANAPSEWSRFADGSIEQRMLVAISAELGAQLRPRPLLLENRNRVEVEGIDPDGRIVVQLVANQGTYKMAAHERAKRAACRTRGDRADRAGTERLGGSRRSRHGH